MTHPPGPPSSPPSPTPESSGDGARDGARDESVALLVKEIRTLLQKIDAPRRRDLWDKLPTITSFVGTVLIAAVGLYFTTSLNERRASEESSRIRAAQRVAELDVVARLIPLLTASDSSQRAYARLLLQSVVATDSSVSPRASGSAGQRAERSQVSQLLVSFAKRAMATDVDSSTRREAVSTIANLAASREIAPGDRQEAESLLTAIADDPKLPADARDLASQAIARLRVVPVREIERFVNEQPVTRAVSEVVLHHTWKPSAADYRGFATLAAIARASVEWNGWSDSPFHFAVAPDGAIWSGRPLQETPVSVQGHNVGTVSVDLILNGDSERPSAAQVASTGALLRALFARFGLTAEQNFAPGRGFHHDYTPSKSCPGTGITKELVMGWVKGN